MAKTNEPPSHEDVIETGGDTGNRQIVTSRVVNATKEKVYYVWTNPKILAQWWGPKGFTNTFETYELKPGGEWKSVMHGPNGRDYPNKIIFVEINENNSLVFDHVSEPKFKVIATFEDAGENKTRVTYRMLFDTVAQCDAVKPYAVDANEQKFDKLDAQLSNI